ncbi:hypothetical protein HELRODRAFT_179826 [Helobdella robusta]|uniref:Uncharacterized protein n=1 Tax=Helobdella robusta TaxID=6412 RepID=T1FF69_HELRO|nr:hypothetical protein HELRODRAFT_179826 [Helobdella robusta]ESN94984.1 hypothetical protein HELRODRAFT_179826 [Helobdella robusta]
MSLAGLQAQYELDRELNASLENSLEELKLSVEDLDKRMDDYDCDSNEWRTRFETQLELSQYLQQRASLLSENIEQAKLTIRECDRGAVEKSRDEIGGGAYHKSNEERKSLVLELNHLKNMADVQQSAFTFNFSSGQTHTNTQAYAHL